MYFFSILLIVLKKNIDYPIYFNLYIKNYKIILKKFFYLINLLKTEYLLIY